MRGTEDEETAALRSLVDARPGIRLHEARAALGISWTALYRRLLAAASHVVVVSPRRRTRLLFPAGRAPSDEELLRARLPRAARLVAEVVAAHRCRDAAEVIARTGLAPRVVYHHLRWMRAAGLVTTSTPRRYDGVRPTRALRKALAESPPPAARGRGELAMRPTDYALPQSSPPVRRVHPDAEDMR